MTQKNWKAKGMNRSCSTYKNSSAVSNVKFVDIAPRKLLFERSLHCNFQSNIELEERTFTEVPNYYSKNEDARTSQHMLTDTHSDVILVVLPLVLLHFTPCQAYMTGKHGSPIQFFFTPYSNLMAMMASTSTEKVLSECMFEN